MSATGFKQPVHGSDTQSGNIRLVAPVADTIIKGGHLVAAGPVQGLLGIMLHDQAGCLDLDRCLSQLHLYTGEHGYASSPHR